MTTASVIRTILMIDMVAMALFAIFYIRQRRMSWTAYCCWSLLALLVPFLGPFLVISNRPGSFDPDLDIRHDLRRGVAFVRRLFARGPAIIYHSQFRLPGIRSRKNAQRGPFNK